MGYEVRMFVVQPFGFEVNNIPMGTELAQIDLSKIGDGPLYQLFKSNTGKANPEIVPPFALYIKSSDRQQEAVNKLRELNYKELADALEISTLTKDPYGDFLGVNKFTDTLTALEQQIQYETTEYGKDKVYRRVLWAHTLLQSIQQTYPKHHELLVITCGH